MEKFTLEDVKYQIKKACEIYKKYPKPGPQEPHTCLAMHIPSTQIENTQPPFYPTPKEIDMADTVQFVWLKWLTPDDRRILWQRYNGVPWKILSYQEGLTIRQARYKVQQSLNKILLNVLKNNDL